MEKFWQWFDDYAAPRLTNRDKTFRAMFEYLDRFDRPIHIVETGCVEDPDNWAGNGCSTILFDTYVRCRQDRSSARSVELIAEKAAAAQNMCLHVEIFAGDSGEVLKDFARDPRKIDLLYLDASHLDWHNPVPSALHHLNELMAIMPALHAETLVVVDDSPALIDAFPRAEIGGKGELVARYAFSVGADLQFLEYQAGWTNITAQPSGDEDSIRDMIGRARSHVEGDRLTAAEPIYRLLLTMTAPPWTGLKRVARGEACDFFAKIAIQTGRYGVAVDWYRDALRADPAAVDYRLDLATRVFLNMGLVENAIVEAERATRVDPLNIKAWRVLGGLHHEARAMDKALEAYEKAERLAHDDPDTALDIAALLLDLENYEGVRKQCAKAKGTERWPDALHVLAMVHFRESRHEEAIDLFDTAIIAECRDAAIAHWHKSQALEAIGRFPEAWEERAWRAHNKTRPALSFPMKRFDRPLLTNDDIKAAAILGGDGRIVHVHAEAGHGDNIAMVRYLPLLHGLGFKVRYETGDDMVDLVRHSMPQIEVVPRAVDYPGAFGIREFDLHAPIGELQNAFRTTINYPAWIGPYIKADPIKVDQYRAKLLPRPARGKRIGLCWSSGIRLNDSYWIAAYGRKKSMHLNDLREFWVAPSDTLVNLQVGPERRQQISEVGPSLVDILPEKPNWTDTAALIANLDLVITVDTSVAHLAGAMGKPTWIMMQEDGASWHFMCARPGAVWNDRSPWYPSVRIFRQERRGDWASVIEDVTIALKSFERETIPA